MRISTVMVSCLSCRRKMLDPRSAARTPAANREPHYRLRYESPVNASPSRIADHAHPWDDEVDGSVSRRCQMLYISYRTL